MKVFTTLDQNTISAIQSENYKHEFAPACLNPPPAFNRETFASHLAQISGILRSFPVRFKQTWPNPSLHQVIIWSDSETHFHDHVKDSDDEQEWAYRGEYIWVLTMDQSGEKVEKVLEFLDSKSTEKLMGLMARAFKKKEEVEGVKNEGVKEGWNY